MRTTKTKRPEKGGTAEEAFRIEEAELVNKRNSVAMALDPSLRLTPPRKR